MRMPRFRRGSGADPGAQTVVQEDAGGGPSVVEEEEVPPPPPPPPPRPVVWPFLLILLLLVAGGLVAAWLLTRDHDGDHKRPAAVTVPNVVRLDQRAAVARLKQARLLARIVSKPSGFPRGTVFRQDPPAGSRLTRGSPVTLSVSATAIVTVPDISGMKATKAVAALRKRGLSVQTSSLVSRQPTGTVVSQSPAAGTRVAKGSLELVRISRGRVQVPDVVGQSRATAVAAVKGAKLVPKVFKVSSTQPKGTVVAQSPRAGARVAGGSTVRLNVSTGAGTAGAPPPPPPPPPPAPVSAVIPDVTGISQALAQRRLNAAGFKSGVVYVPSDRPQQVVVSQSPSAGTQARRGTRIQLNASLGPTPGPQRSVPGVVGFGVQQAIVRLEAAGFKVQRLTRSVSNRSQAGTVVDEQPAGGRSAPTGSTVTIYVGRFPG